MYRMRSALGLGLLAGIIILCSGATMDVGPAASQPANWKVTDDPNWIGPNSWQRHFTIPPFVDTPQGTDVKMATSRPAADVVPSYVTRSSKSGSSTGKTGTASTTTGKSSSSKTTHSSSSSHRSSHSSHSSHSSSSSKHTQGTY